ncbi:MAG TPA: S8 family serine peptidase [Mycobacteriales bacterium]|nr:S8 family serine peptidase [Mycobacteriales bacterium]
MRTRALSALALPLVAAATALTSTPALAQTESAPPSSYLVTLAPGTGAVAPVVTTLLSRYGGSLRFTYSHALRGFSATLPSAAAERLAHDPLVALVEPNVAMRINDVQSGAQYDLDRTDQRSGLDTKYTYNATGAGVTAYDLDTGIRPTHTQFGGRASVGYDAIGDGKNGIDCNGHGTHTAGSIAASTYGMAKQARVVGVRVLACDGSGTADQIIAGLDWVTRNAVKPAVANMSIGTQVGTSATIDAAVRGLVNSGVPIAVSAGNGYGNGLYAEDACTHSPSDEPLALTVSAVNNTDTKPIWANYGTCVDLFAGGVDVNSSWYTSDTATSLSSGTSMSSPHVAGAAAMYLSANPSATPAQVATFLTSQATTGAVKSAGSGSPNKLLYVGGITGGGGGGGGNVAPSASFTTTTSGLTVTATDTSTDSDGTIASRAWNFGDGATASGTPVSHAYAAAGTYTVTLTVTDNAGATATTTRSVTVSTTGDPDPATPTLTSGVAKSDTNGATGTWKYYKVAVPTAGRTVALTLTGPSCGLLSCPADLDLYGRNGAKPTTAAFTCSSATGSSSESCTITNAPAGYTYVGVYVYSGTAGKAYTVKATVT